MSTGKRHWLVTGGSRGIGRAVVEQAAAAGDSVASLARAVSSTPWTHPERVLEVKADITEPDSVRAAIESAMEAFGSIDVIVNGAGVHRGGRIEDLSHEAWDLVIGTNLTGAFEVCRAAVPLLGAGASVVNVGAVVGLRGFPGDVAYGSAKAGLSGLTQVLASELAPRGIRVNLVVPGFVDTDMTSRISERAREKIVAAIPAGRTGTAEEIAEVIVGVAGWTYMTGATVAVDGGLLTSFSGHTR